MSESEQRAAFDAWCKAAPDGWEPILATPGKWMVWQAACEWANERAAKRIAELEAALKPLEGIAGRVFYDGMNSSKADDATLYGFDGAYITYGDLRRARAVLSQEEQHD